MARKKQKKYVFYIGLIILSIILLSISLTLEFVGYISINTMFTILKISLILLIISVFVKSKI